MKLLVLGSGGMYRVMFVESEEREGEEGEES